MNRSGIFIRGAAYLLDFIIYGVASALIYVACFQYELFNDNDLWNIKHAQLAPSLLQKLFLIQVSLYFIYFVTEFLFAASIGKICLGVSIGSSSGRAANPFQLLIRFLFKHSSMFLYSAGYVLVMEELKVAGVISSGVVGVGCLLIFGPDRMALHDYLSQTAVLPSDEIKYVSTKDAVERTKAKEKEGFRRRPDLDKW